MESKKEKIEQSQIQIQLRLQEEEKNYLAQKKTSNQEMINANHELLMRRNITFRKVEKEARLIKEAFSDIKALVDDQEPVLNQIVQDIEDSEGIAKNAEKNLLQAEEKQKRWCIIL
jgi:hypothetical protein